jgi:hypothetical protein
VAPVEKKVETAVEKMTRMASMASLGEDDPNSQDNDPDYGGPKKAIKAGNKEFADHYDVIGLGRERYQATVGGWLYTLMSSLSSSSSILFSPAPAPAPPPPAPPPLPPAHAPAPCSAVAPQLETARFHQPSFAY